MTNFRNRLIIYAFVALLLLGYELAFVRPVRSFAIILAIAVVGISLISFFYNRQKKS